MSQANQDQKYFDLHISGIGYLNRVREVQVKRGQPFLAVDVSALHGDAEDVQYTRFDCRVSGSEAQEVIQLLLPEIQAGKKVLASFKLGDLYTDTFVYEKGEKKGQTGVSLKARLLIIHWAKVDGKHVLPVASDASSSDAQDAATDKSLTDEIPPAAPATQEAGRSSLDGLI
ncbi:MAG: STY4534 family ICE replication protein [Pseudomonadota bacterium]